MSDNNSDSENVVVVTDTPSSPSPSSSHPLMPIKSATVASLNGDSTSASSSSAVKRTQKAGSVRVGPAKPTKSDSKKKKQQQQAEKEKEKQKQIKLFMPTTPKTSNKPTVAATFPTTAAAPIPIPAAASGLSKAELEAQVAKLQQLITMMDDKGKGSNEVVDLTSTDVDMAPTTASNHSADTGGATSNATAPMTPPPNKPVGRKRKSTSPSPPVTPPTSNDAAVAAAAIPVVATVVSSTVPSTPPLLPSIAPLTSPPAPTSGASSASASSPSATAIPASIIAPSTPVSTSASAPTSESSSSSMGSSAKKQKVSSGKKTKETPEQREARKAEEKARKQAEQEAKKAAKAKEAEEKKLAKQREQEEKRLEKQRELEAKRAEKQKEIEAKRAEVEAKKQEAEQKRAEKQKEQETKRAMKEAQEKALEEAKEAERRKVEKSKAILHGFFKIPTNAAPSTPAKAGKSSTSSPNKHGSGSRNGSGRGSASKNSTSTTPTRAAQGTLDESSSNQLNGAIACAKTMEKEKIDNIRDLLFLPFIPSTDRVWTPLFRVARTDVRYEHLRQPATVDNAEQGEKDVQDGASAAESDGTSAMTSPLSYCSLDRFLNCGHDLSGNPIPNLLDDPIRIEAARARAQRRNRMLMSRRKKLIQFHDNYRPAWYGRVKPKEEWKEMSEDEGKMEVDSHDASASQPSRRVPLPPRFSYKPWMRHGARSVAEVDPSTNTGNPDHMLNYAFDSDEEWGEEPDDGEELTSDEEDGEDGDEDTADGGLRGDGLEEDGWLIPEEQDPLAPINTGAANGSTDAAQSSTAAGQSVSGKKARAREVMLPVVIGPVIDLDQIAHQFVSKRDHKVKEEDGVKDTDGDAPIITDDMRELMQYRKKIISALPFDFDPHRSWEIPSGDLSQLIPPTSFDIQTSNFTTPYKSGKSKKAAQSAQQQRQQLSVQKEQQGTLEMRLAAINELDSPTTGVDAPGSTSSAVASSTPFPSSVPPPSLTSSEPVHVCMVARKKEKKVVAPTLIPPVVPSQAAQHNDSAAATTPTSTSAPDTTAQSIAPIPTIAANVEKSKEETQMQQSADVQPMTIDA